eukprot:147291_1
MAKNLILIFLLLFCNTLILNEGASSSSVGLSNDIREISTNPSSSSKNTVLFFVMYGSIVTAIIISIIVCTLICQKLNCCCCKNYDKFNYNDHHDSVICYKITGFFNHLIEATFETIGAMVAKCPYVCCASVLVFTLVLSFGVFFIEFEDNIFDLWTPTDSPIFKEREFISRYWSQKDYGLNIMTAVSKDGLNEEILNENNLNEWLEFHINYRLNLPKKTYTWTDDNEATHSVEFGYFADNLNSPLNETYLKDLGTQNTKIDNYLFRNKLTRYETLKKLNI